MRELVAEALLAAFPRTFAAALKRNYLTGALRRLNESALFDLKQCCLDGNLAGFEDLAPLFWSSPMNRGVLRQDLDEATALYRAIRQLVGPVGVEIGRCHGGSTLLLACAVGPRGRVISIDIAPRGDGALREVLQRAGVLARVELLVLDANRAAVDSPLDFLFVDGDHSYAGAKRDHNRWAPQVRPGGLVAYHDMAFARPMATQEADLKRLRDEILAQKPACLKLLREAGSLSIFERTDSPWVEIRG
jgi:predicted O-methyltransferase YrrM